MITYSPCLPDEEPTPQKNNDSKKTKNSHLSLLTPPTQRLQSGYLLDATNPIASVISSNTILVGTFADFIWIRCEGKGSFANSPQMKQAAESSISKGFKRIVIDLEACTAMDSTFMGTMAGIAMKLAKLGYESLYVADANDKTKSSLEDLGLSSLIQINPENPFWEADVKDIRSKLLTTSTIASVDKTQHVLDAHRRLCEADDSNDEKFATVLDVLEAELANRQDSTQS